MFENCSKSSPGQVDNTGASENYAGRRVAWDATRSDGVFGTYRPKDERHAIQKGFAIMARCHLRVYHGPETLQAHTFETQQENTVRVSFGEIYPLLADAVNNRRTWLKDFEFDEVTLPTDLYEVLLAYQFGRRPSA